MNSGFVGWPSPTPQQRPYARIEDQKAQNTGGGTFTSGADRTRDLNTIVADSASFAALASNQLTLQAGTYEYRISAPAYQTARHQAWLFNVTDGVVQQRGTSEYIGAASLDQNRSWIQGQMKITKTTVFEVRHRCESTSATLGFGVASNFGTEVYVVAEFWRIA